MWLHKNHILLVELAKKLKIKRLNVNSFFLEKKKITETQIITKIF